MVLILYAIIVNDLCVNPHIFSQVVELLHPDVLSYERHLSYWLFSKPVSLLLL
jgi:hypothetical protein